MLPFSLKEHQHRQQTPYIIIDCFIRLETMRNAHLLIIAAHAWGVSAFTTPAAFHTTGTGTSSSSRLFNNVMEGTYTTLFDQVNAALGLQQTDFTATYLNGGTSWTCPMTGSKGTAEWYSESSPQFLTGVSKCSQVDVGGAEFSINVWMGPSYDVPNMLLKFGATADGSNCFVIADYVPRGATPLGSDASYSEAYYGGEVANAWNSAASIPGVTSLPPDMSMEFRTLYSPARIAFAGLTQADATNIATSHVQRFLSWVQSAPQVPARSRGSFNLRDDKLRQFYFRGEVQKNCAMFGPDLGMSVAAVS